MKKKVKKLLALGLAVMMMVAASVVGTIAYLTSRDSVTNTFTVGNVEIKVDEAKVTPDGAPVAGADRVKGNEYHLIPGQSYTKDPTMTVVKGSEESYVRMLVTINKTQATLDEVFGVGFLPQNYVEGWDSSVWPCVGVAEDSANTSITYEFRYNGTVNAVNAADDIVLKPLFTKFVLPGTVDNEGLKTLNAEIGGFVITVEGHAIQTASFADEAAAWAAFDTQYAQQNP